MALSDAALKALNGKDRDAVTEVADRDGLSVRVSQKGKVVFQLRYRYDGQPARLDLGTYPALNLKAARAEAQRLRGELEQGHNPKIVRALEKQTILTADSVESLFRQWFEAYCKKNKKGHHDIMRSFELHVLPKIGALPAEKVTLQQWLAILEKLAVLRPGIADRILTNAKQMLKWGVKRELIAVNPLNGINASEDLQIKKKAGSRSLSNEEIVYVWRATEESRMATKNKIFVKLCLIYGCRNGELRAAEKVHCDFKNKVWTVPPENHKLGKTTRKPLLRPITKETEALFKQAIDLSGDSRFIFTNSGSEEPMGTSAPLALPYNIMQWLRRHKGYQMTHWSIHDLRKTARTNFSTLTEPHIAEIMLGHKLPGSWQVYDQYDYLLEQAKAYEAWTLRLAQTTA